MAISFAMLLVVETLGMTGALTLLLIRGSRGKEQEGQVRPILNLRFAPVLAAFVLAVAYFSTPEVGQARFLFFMAESLVLSAASILVFTSSDPRIGRAAIILVISVNVLNGLATKLVLGGIVWGEDERAYMMNALQIGMSGRFTSVQSGFYQVPSIPQLLYTLSSLTSLPLDVTLTIVSSVFMILFQGVIYLFSSYLTRDFRVVFAIQVVTIFVPRLVLMQQVIPEALSLILSALVLYFLARIILGDSSSQRRDFAVAMLLYAAVVLTHPSGTIAPLTLLLLFSIVYSQRIAISSVGHRLGISSTASGGSLPKILLILTGVAAAAYWVSIPQVKTVIVGQLSSFLSALGSRGPPSALASYVPLYTSSGLQYTIAWAVPVVLSSAYYLARIVSGRNESRSKQESLGLLCFAGGIVLAVGSFLILASSPASGADRYLGSPAYLLIVLSLAPPITLLLSRAGTKILVAMFLILLVAMIAVGPSIPDISPDSHATIFEPPTSSSIQFFSSSLPLFPTNATIAAEKDFVAPVSSQALLEEQKISPLYALYKPTRDLLGGLAQGTINISSYEKVFFIVDTALLPGFLPQVRNSSNIYLSSGRFVLVS
jgi:hypothetical protein